MDFISKHFIVAGRINKQLKAEEIKTLEYYERLSAGIHFVKGNSKAGKAKPLKGSLN